MGDSWARGRTWERADSHASNRETDRLEYLTFNSPQGLVALRMGRKQLEYSKITRLEARTRVLQGVGKLSILAFSLAVGFVVVATAVPQHRQLLELEAKLEESKQAESLVLEELEFHQVEYRALREDSGFLETHARDRLGYYREGEHVFKVRRR